MSCSSSVRSHDGVARAHRLLSPSAMLATARQLAASGAKIERVTLAAKLQLKPGMTVVAVRAPEEIATELSAERETADARPADAVLVFAQNRDQLRAEAEPLVDAARRDALAWLAYPKGGQLGTDLNRDSVAGLLSAEGIRAVRQVAIDETWSALRFRPA